MKSALTSGTTIVLWTSSLALALLSDTAPETLMLLVWGVTLLMVGRQVGSRVAGDRRDQPHVQAAPERPARTVSGVHVEAGA